MIKVCYVLAYNPPNYVRTETLLASLRALPDVELCTAINSTTGVMRYIQTLWRLMIVRIRYRPDMYMLGFRGYEVYWPVRFLTLGKPLVFDEFINPYLWFVEEHKKLSPDSIYAKLLKQYSRAMLVTSTRVLTDTKLSADYSRATMNIPIEKFSPIYVGTNEEMFDALPKKKQENTQLRIFFYGNFLPLHGIDIILAAANELREESVKFTIIGGAKRRQDMEKFTESIAEMKLKNIDHKPWVPYEQLPGYIADADLCLGGPFGGTPQANLVITGKTYQFLRMGKCTVIGRVDEEVGFRDKENCILVEQNSVDSLVRAVRWALKHRKSLDIIGAHGRKLYEKKFSQSAQLYKVGNVIEQAVQQK